MVIFNSYVKLPEGICVCVSMCGRVTHNSSMQNQVCGRGQIELIF